MALGEAKRETWLKAKNTLSTCPFGAPAKTNIPFPSETMTKPDSPEIPEIKMDKASEISLKSIPFPHIAVKTILKCKKLL